MCAAAALLAPWSRSAPRGGLRAVRVAAAVLVGVAAIVAADSVGRLASAEHDRILARDTLRSDPLEALRLASRSLALNGDSVSGLGVKGAAYARLGDYRHAQAAMRRAVRLEPHDHLPWALLGDLAVRRGNLRAARRYYRRVAY